MTFVPIRVLRSIMISNIQAPSQVFIPASDHLNVCNDQRSTPTILLSHFAYSYNRISGCDTMHKSLLVFIFFFKFQIEQLKLCFKNCFAMSGFPVSRFIGLDDKALNRASE